ncbi:MAG: hypothetical protein DRI71_06215 [Bacteroidetes bacterium]|nr:MAG: hypothetical protein DRI71_06215 [Bacteroidota bacterium]
MKRFLKLFLVLIIITLVGYFSGNYILTRVSHKYVAELKSKLEAKGLFFEELSYKDISIRSLRSVSINNVNLTFTLDKEIYGRKSFHSSFHAQNIIINLVSIQEAKVTFSLNNFSLHVEPGESSERKTFGEFEEAHFTCTIPISLRTPETSAKDVLLQVENLFQQNKAIGLSLSGIAKISIGEERVKLAVKTVEKRDSVYLHFNQTDILQAAKTFDIELAEKEAEVIANHPSLVPAMIRITGDARQKSRAYRSRDKSFPEDAFRHVYWSYHLTREFGFTLAKQITDAHETAPGNTAKERAMDFHNNEIARELAKGNLSEAQIVNLVLTSNNIIRHPSEVLQ